MATMKIVYIPAQYNRSSICSICSIYIFLFLSTLPVNVIYSIAKKYRETPRGFILVLLILPVSSVSLLPRAYTQSILLEVNRKNGLTRPSQKKTYTTFRHNTQFVFFLILLC